MPLAEMPRRVPGIFQRLGRNRTLFTFYQPRWDDSFRILPDRTRQPAADRVLVSRQATRIFDCPGERQ